MDFPAFLLEPYMLFVLAGAVLVIVLAGPIWRGASRIFNALFYDYVVDLGLSTLDNFLGGAGLAGLDVGDWVAAVIIFWHERKITNTWVALLVAWEATNFIPLSFIPVVGEGLEIFFNFFPAVTVGRFLFAKYEAAKMEKEKLKELSETAKQEGVKTDDQKETVEEVDELIKEDDPVDALEKAKGAEKDMVKDLRKEFDRRVTLLNQAMDKLEQLEGPEDAIAIIEDGFAQAESLMDSAALLANKNDYKQAFALLRQAQERLAAAAQAFDAATAYDQAA